MAGSFYIQGETKTRPSAYQRYQKSVADAAAGARDGIVAAAVTAQWGELNKIVTIETVDAAKEVFGSGGNAYGLISQILAGGASKVLAVRVGSSGTKSTVTLADTGSPAVNAVDVTAKYEGTRTFSYLLRGVVGDDTKREFVLIEGGVELESIKFAVSADGEVDALIAAGASSKYMTFAKSSGYAGTGKLTLVTTATTIAAGTAVTVTSTEYSAAFIKTEPYRFNCIVVDTNDTAVHALLTAFMNRVYGDGKTGFAVIGEPVSVAIATRQADAAAFNDYNVVYVGSGWYDSANTLVDGYLAAGRVAGMIASTPSNKAITHVGVTGAVAIAEMLTNSQIETCIQNGVVIFTQSSTGSVWIEAGITTLVTPSGNDDAGWKKIKRAKIRFEVFDRINDTISPMVGQINNNADGRAHIIQQSIRVLLNLAGEQKIEPDYEMFIDPDNAPTGDSAWFLIGFTDIDSLEKIYLAYHIGGLTTN